jgi:hypothetical protein
MVPAYTFFCRSALLHELSQNLETVLSVKGNIPGLSVNDS